MADDVKPPKVALYSKFDEKVCRKPTNTAEHHKICAPAFSLPHYKTYDVRSTRCKYVCARSHSGHFCTNVLSIESERKKALGSRRYSKCRRLIINGRYERAKRKLRHSADKKTHTHTYSPKQKRQPGFLRSGQTKT